MFAKNFVLSGLAALGSAHVLLSNPVPYGRSDLKNFPLNLDGSNFPCQQRPTAYDAQGASNVYAQGSQQQLSFVGSAVHGGGSCQISVTTDLQPTKDSKWKVIHSIIGGCPARDMGGNYDANDAKFINPNKYSYTIPKELAAGNYTLAWTWFNKVGNREMYMNCAPLTVTGSGGSSNFMNTLPDMYKANIYGEDGCRTPNNENFPYPNPGKNVVYENKVTPTVTLAATDPCIPVNGGGGPPAPYPPPAQTQVPSSAPRPTNVNNPVQPPPPSGTKPGGVYITVSSGQPAATSAPPVASQPAAPSSVAPAPGAGNPGGSSPAGGHPQGTACSTEGTWNCVGGTSFQRCASGAWSSLQPMGAGMQCTAGESSNLEAKTKVSKRNLRRARRFAA
ncbi:hypothetical protein JDV02_005040 [Purpureocillium takamizusanense]|uniref:Auxiliary Activity family 9 catalytic domain-containing protein n=1 Tax=Purpureocillium takamizusanense TaxID=2060973 RepID=A0A9Q8QFL9_9HYPO|nr:uncharacterized protein JDV02_005040 [Purpureocillium takamizusanense]UNI18790.1 hypothetical protein JDV02_005040 [Purpureocillium takamizusanense]